jgi:hypothetical protein
VLAGTCVSGNLTVVEFRAVGNELLALNFTLYDREGGIYKKGAEWPRLMTPPEDGAGVPRVSQETPCKRLDIPSGPGHTRGGRWLYNSWGLHA